MAPRQSCPLERLLLAGLALRSGGFLVTGRRHYESWLRGPLLVGSARSQLARQRAQVCHRKQIEAPYGDRRQKCFYGQDLDAEQARLALDACLLSEAELAEGPQAWTRYPDPAPMDNGSRGGTLMRQVSSEALRFRSDL